MKYVIIGNSAAAIGCVEGIREVDRDGRILIISDEIHHSYSRPLISYLLMGKTDLERMKYRPDSFYADMGCEVMLGGRVTKITPDKKTVSLDDVTEIDYEKLLVATGSRPIVPHVHGIERVKNSTTFMYLDDAKKLQSTLKPDSRVMILGAGLIGLKCAECLADKVGGITVVDMAPRILPSILDTEGAEIVRKHLESKGMEIILNESAAEFSESSAKLKSGKTIDFDLLVIAVGVRPNISLVSDCGGKVGRGIVINDRCETSIPDVYSAGDCSEGFDSALGEMRILAILPNAYMQGFVAGVNMAGGDAMHEKAIPMNAIGLCGLHIITAGVYEGDSFVRRDGENYKALFYRDNLLKGFILIGDVARAGIYTSLIREKTPLDILDFELIKERPQLMAFARNTRRALLGELR